MPTNFHNRFFPVPNFLLMPTFGLDISDASIKFVKLNSDRHGIKIVQYGEKKIPLGIIESGKIKDSKKLEEILIRLRKEEGVKSVRLSLPEEQIYLFRMKLAKEGLRNIQEGIELSLEEHVPILAQDAVFDYEIIKEKKENIEIQVAVIPRGVIQSYLSVFENSKITVASCELEAQAIARAVIKRGGQDTYMLVDFGEKRTGISIISEGEVVFSSTLDFGGEMLTNMIKKSFKVDFEEAEKIKLKYGLQRNVGNKETFAVLLNGVSILRDEIAKHFLYWQSHRDADGENNPLIKKIILCGGNSSMIGLSDYFSVSMKNPVEIGNVWVNMINLEGKIPEINFNKSLSFATAIGLALANFFDD